MLWEALCWAPMIFTSSLRFAARKDPWAEQLKNGDVSEATAGRAWPGSGSPVGNGSEAAMGRGLVGKVLVSSGFGIGNLLATGKSGMDEWPNTTTGCTDRIFFVLAVEIGRDRHVDFSDWGVSVDETGVRATINRDYDSKEAERRTWLGSQTSTPSIAPPQCRRERPQRGRTVRTFWPREL